MRRFFTSDHHYGHANILKFEPMKRVDSKGHVFADVTAMDDYMIKQWNTTVGKDDLVYYLGDFTLGFSFYPLVNKLNGKKILVIGNHDKGFKQFCKRQELPKIPGFAEIHKEVSIEVDGIGKVKLSHFPYESMLPDPHGFQHARPQKGDEDLLLHGHVHSLWTIKKEPETPLMINVAVENWGLKPVAEAEILAVYQAWRFGDRLRRGDEKKS